MAASCLSGTCCGGRGGRGDGFPDLTRAGRSPKTAGTTRSRPAQMAAGENMKGIRPRHRQPQRPARTRTAQGVWADESSPVRPAAPASAGHGAVSAGQPAQDTARLRQSPSLTEEARHEEPDGAEHPADPHPFRSAGRRCAPGWGQATGAPGGARHQTRAGHGETRSEPAAARCRSAALGLV